MSMFVSDKSNLVGPISSLALWFPTPLKIMHPTLILFFEHKSTKLVGYYKIGNA